MSLNISSSLIDGLRRVANRNGLVLTLAYLVVGAVWQVAFYSAFAAYVGQFGTPTTTVALPSVDVPLSVSAGVALLSLLVLQYLTVVAIRTFVGGHAHSIPSEYYTRNIAFVLVNSILGAVAFGVLVVFGTVLFLIPGIIAYVAFIFTMFYVPVDDTNFLSALSKSWSLTRGNWIRLFVLLAVVGISTAIVSNLLSVASSLLLGAFIGRWGSLVAGVLTLPFSLLTLGVLAEAFTRLREMQSRPSPPSSTIAD